MKKLIGLILLLSSTSYAQFNGCLLTAVNQAQRLQFSQYGQVPGFHTGCLVTESDNNTLYIWTGSAYDAIASTSGMGSVSSVGLTVPSFLSVSGSPITTSGTFGVTLSGSALPAGSGGTGLTAPGTSGNVLTSNGTTWISSAVTGGANTALSNLAAVAANTDIVPGANNSFNLGSFSDRWENVDAGRINIVNISSAVPEMVFFDSSTNGYGEFNISYVLPDGNTAQSAFTDAQQFFTEPIAITTFNAGAQTAGISIETGNASSGNSGPIIIQPGTATGTAGNILENGSVVIGTTSTTPTHSLNTATATPASGVGTFTNLPTGFSGNPTGYISININGSPHVIPYW